ncbi:MAG: hypothetical protein AB7D51_06785 [Desulfovibrionaceae bacterium]
MNTHALRIGFAAFCLAALCLPALPALAQEPVTVTQTPGQAPAGAQGGEEPVLSAEMQRLHTDFASFSDSWVVRLNNTHSEGKPHAKTIQEDGLVKTRYHLIEKKSSVVRESPSRPGHFCGILRYQDTVYECQGETEAACLESGFQPVPGTAMGVSEIFQYMNGAWR